MRAGRTGHSARAARGTAADYLLAAEAALGLIGSVEVAQRWADPSALPKMTVGAVAAHLGQQVLLVHAAVTAGRHVSDEAPVPVLEHYARTPWLGADLDHDANVAIRDASQESARAGHDPLVATMQEFLEELRRAFGRPSSRLPAGISLPAWDWTLSFDDFLLTRIMELVVHSDDLAASVDVEPPVLPEPVLGPVLALLVGVSLRRHGQSALLRALTRSERAPESIAAL